ncbi:MAG: type VI immunity family protein [Burkholderia gladioli]
MTKDELIAWANDPRRQDTLPFGLYEPLEQKAIVGAALVVRGALYFKGGCTKAVREAIVGCYSRYMTAIDDFGKAFAKAAELESPKAGPMRWFYEEGKSPVEFAKSTGLPGVVKGLTSEQVLVATTTSAAHKLATGFFEFSVFCISDWQAEQGDRGLDAMVFTVPRRFLEMCPGTFEKLFTEFAAVVPTKWGHAGIGVNLPPLDPEANEASENFWSRLYGPGVDVGDPLRPSIRELADKIKTVDWLTALDEDFVRCAGGADTLMLPPDWFRKTRLDNGGLLIQAGVDPVAGVPIGKGIPPAPPAAYVLLNHALRSIVADKSGILQRGTINSTAPLLNTTVASEAWLQRFNVPDDELNGYWVELHKTPKLRAPL